jgi:predicted transcriptional regulator
VEQFIKDLLGGSQYECERKLKEAEALLEKLTKKMMELNNGMNDFEMEIKKGIQQSPDDADILKEGKKLSDENTNDRKALKDIED